MPRTKKEPVYQYGIEITKPHSKAMYDHNDLVADEMKNNILNAWKNELAIIKEYHDVNALVEDWDEELLKEHAPKLVKLQKGVCYSGYGMGYTIDMVNEEFIKELDTMANWQLHQDYSYMSFDNGLVPRTRFMMVGFEWQKHDYSYCTDKDLSPVLDMVGEIELTK